MKQLFILGAGFSKAILTSMPTLWQLSQDAIEWDDLPVNRSKYVGLSDDVEQLLTYLYQEMPWKAPEEIHLDKAAFHMISKSISTYIAQCEDQGFDNGVPEWAFRFANYLHRQRASVASLNYDTIIETLATSVYAEGDGSAPHPHFLSDSSIYRLPITNLLHRTAAVMAGSETDTFRLLKLHGSINWFSSGDVGGDVGHQVYFEAARRMLPQYKGSQREQTYLPTGEPVWETPSSFAPAAKRKYSSDYDRNRMDLVPLIIPPVADKSTFYKSHLVKVLWSEFRNAIQEAEEIYCVGYSLPKSDLTVRLFLRSSVTKKGKEVFLVNNAKGNAKEALLENYREVFGDNLREDYLGVDDAVEKMVADLSAS